MPPGKKSSRLPHRTLLASVLLAMMQAPAAAQTPVSIELVLAVDTSRSVDDAEYALQMAGIAKAFRNPGIIDLIRQQDGVAVTLFQWSSAVNRTYAIPWQVLRDRGDALAFAAAVETAPRDPLRGFTAIGLAIEYGIRLITDNDFNGRHLKVDISGDGRNNTGPLPTVAAQGAKAQGIVINGLPILVDTYNLQDYFRDKVIHGAGAFIEIANDYRDFQDAFRRKLRREIAPAVSRRYAPPKSRRTQAACHTDAITRPRMC